MTTDKQMHTPDYTLSDFEEIVIALIKKHQALQHQRDSLLEALKVAKESIEEATRLSALYNGHEYSFSSAMQKICAAIQSAGGNP